MNNAASDRRCYRHVLPAFLAALLLCGCGSLPRTSHGPVRKVGTNDVAGAEELAETARTVGNADYAKIASILQVDPRDAPAAFKIEFKEQVWAPYRGPTAGFAGRKEFAATFKHKEKTWTLLKFPLSRRRIELSASILGAMPARLPRTLRHEMAHLYQDYADGAPDYWREGIADYVACALSQDSFPDCLQCTVTQSHYQDGYSCAAAFLKHIEDGYEPRIVPKLHATLLQGGYSEDFFERNTGRSLDALWSEFQQSPRFTTDASVGQTLRAQLKELAEKRDPRGENPVRSRRSLKSFSYPGAADLCWSKPAVA